MWANYIGECAEGRGGECKRTGGMCWFELDFWIDVSGAKLAVGLRADARQGSGLKRIREGEVGCKRSGSRRGRGIEVLNATLFIFRAV